MQLQIYAVYDDKAKLYLQPFFLRSTPEAVRAFGDLCNNPDHPFSAHPEDYSLWHFGEWKEESGQFVTAAGSCLVQGLHLVKMSEVADHGNGQIDIEDQILGESADA